MPRLASLACAQEAVPRARLDQEYRLIEPTQPALIAWEKRKPHDVEFRHVPALREAWTAYTRIFYTLEALREVERLHSDVYRAYHIEKLHIDNPEVIANAGISTGTLTEDAEDIQTFQDVIDTNVVGISRTFRSQ